MQIIVERFVYLKGNLFEKVVFSHFHFQKMKFQWYNRLAFCSEEIKNSSFHGCWDNQLYTGGRKTRVDSTNTGNSMKFLLGENELCVKGINQILATKGESCWWVLEKLSIILVSSEKMKRILLPWGNIYIT